MNREVGGGEPGKVASEQRWEVREWALQECGETAFQVRDNSRYPEAGSDHASFGAERTAGS